MSEQFDLSEEQLAALLADALGGEVELRVRDLSGGALATHSAPARAKVEDVLREVVASAGLPEGRYALFAMREGGDPVRLDPTRTLADCLQDAGLGAMAEVEVVLAPELEGNAG